MLISSLVWAEEKTCDGNYVTVEDIKLCADKGVPIAQDMLGDLYLYGNEIPINYKEFFKWKMQAVKNGRKSAQFDLSLAYINGWGVPKNTIKAYMWMSLYQINYQQPIVKLNMDQLQSQLSSKDLAIAQDMAAKCQARNFKNCD